MSKRYTLWRGKCLHSSIFYIYIDTREELEVTYMSSNMDIIKYIMAHVWDRMLAFQNDTEKEYLIILKSIQSVFLRYLQHDIFM